MRLRAVLFVAALVVPCMIAGCVVLAAPSAIQENVATVSTSTSAKNVIDVPVIYTAAKQYVPLSWLHGGERFPQGAMLMVHDGKGERLLSDKFAASSDANISFDGKSVLFAAKQHAGEAWQAWVLSFKDGQLTQLTKGTDDIIKPMYLPANRIVYARKSRNRFVLEALSLNDGKVMPLSYAPGSYLPTDVLHDGRILFSSSYPLGTDGAPEIYAVYSDGTGVESYRCDHGTGRSAGRELSSGDIVFPSRKGPCTVYISASPAGCIRFASGRLCRRRCRSYVSFLSRSVAAKQQAALSDSVAEHSGQPGERVPVASRNKSA